MNLSFENIQKLVPQVHILIVGIGGYPYLKNGSKINEEPHYVLKSMGQLTSPPLSAEAFYNTSIKLHDEENWSLPLGSVQVLISNYNDQNPVLPGVVYHEPTMTNIENEYYRWKSRCGSHEDNIAIFYFCGHGLEKDHQILLPMDFGENNNYPWRNSFSFDKTRAAFHGCKAKTQLFFIDACRSVTDDLLGSDISFPSLDYELYVGGHAAHDLTQKATAKNEQSFGLKNSVSIYTQALIMALEGLAAVGEDDSWQVGTNEISGKIHALMKIVDARQGFEQRCTHTASEDKKFIKFKNPPEATLELTVSPEIALGQAKMSCIHSDNGEMKERILPEPKPWKLKLPAGPYKVSATFHGHTFTNSSKTILVSPPHIYKTLKCN